MTYTDLKEDIKKHLDKNPDTPDPSTRAKIHKHISAINKWMAVFKLEESSRIQEHFRPEAFATHLEIFNQTLTADGASVNTIGPLKTYIRFAHNLFISFHSTEMLYQTKDFKLILRALMRESGIANGLALSKQTGIDRSTVHRWLRGQTKPIKKEHVDALERVLGRPSGEIADVLPAGVANGRSQRQLNAERKKKWLQNDYLRTKAELYQLPYGVNFNEIPRVKKEYEAYFELKTGLTTTKGTERKQRWKVRADGYCGSAEKFKDMLTMIFGFFTNSEEAEDIKIRGLGLDKMKVSIAQISDTDLVLKYFHFMSTRSNMQNADVPSLEMFPKVTKNYLTAFRAILKPGTGYLWQHAEIFTPITTNSDTDTTTWKRRCEEAYYEYGRWLRDFRFHKGRDQHAEKNDPIYKILEQECPLDELKQVKKNLRDEMKKVSDPRQHAILWRDLALISLLSVFPIRSINVKFLSLKSNLHRKPDGRWWLCFDEHEIKNDKKIEVCLDDPDGDSKEVSEIFDEYIKHRTLLQPNPSEFVFLPSIYRLKKGASKVRLANPAQVAAKITERFGPSRCPIHIHRFRDIVATNFVRNYPLDGFRRAARALFDSEEIVRRAYAHVSKKDGMRGVYEPHEETKDPELRNGREKKKASELAINVDPASDYIERMTLRTLKTMTKDLIISITPEMPNYVREEVWSRVVEARKGTRSAKSA